MYGLDINFLNDRPEYKPTPTERRRGGGMAPGDRRATFLGLGVGVALLALTGGAWLFLQSQNSQLRDRQVQLQAELGALKADQTNLANINAEVNQTKAETAALAGVFNAIKPWSATFTDISSRTPPNVRIVSITQKEPPPSQQPSPSPSPSAAASPSPSAAASPAAAPSPPPTGIIEIKGQATSFSDVNDFLLVLQNSRFLKGDQTKIVTAQLGEPRPLQFIQLGKQSSGQSTNREGPPPKLPPEVAFTIQTELTDVPASELVQELESKKATGLVTRIERLQQKGVVKP